jgi:hypothetical protein
MWARTKMSRWVLVMATRSSSGWDLLCGSTLVGMHAKCKNMEDPWKMLKKTPFRNSITTKTLIPKTPLGIGKINFQIPTPLVKRHCNFFYIGTNKLQGVGFRSFCGQ